MPETNEWIEAAMPRLQRIAASVAKWLPAEASLIDELVNIGVVRILQDAPRFDVSKGTFESYAFSRALGAMRNELKSRYRLTQVLACSYDLEPIGHSENSSSAIDQMGSTQPTFALPAKFDVHGAIARLPLQQQQVVHQVYFQGTAAGGNTNVKRLERARTSMRNFLSN